MANPRTFPASRLVENHGRLDVDALWVAHALHAGRISTWACSWLVVTIEAEPDAIRVGDQRVPIERVEFFNGRYSRVRFCCPDCSRGCRILHHTDRGWLCRLCARYDYASRHTDRWAPGLRRLAYLRQRLATGRRMRGWTKRRLHEAMLAHEGNVIDSFHEFVTQLKGNSDER